MTTIHFNNKLVSMQDELRRYAYKLTVDINEADDLLQETSLKALINKDKFTDGTNFKGWMYTIMKNIFINDYRKSSREQTFVDKTDNLAMIDSMQYLYADSTEQLHDNKELKKVVSKLPGEFKIPFMMFTNGYKYKEISEKLNIPIGTVKSRIFSTRKKLQSELKDFVN